MRGETGSEVSRPAQNAKYKFLAPPAFTYREIMEELEELIIRGQGTGGVWGVGPPLELVIYIVKILKIRKIIFFISIGPPLGKKSEFHSH